ncbi:hypothetical protein ACI2KS_23810 [Pseudomonas sp. NPDC087358]|uniref:hypothetical protein n=1 Tax=Pseudomonas sp. NPDC087358 TaxID=3364439 RepID=UPI00384CDB1D
MSRPENTTAPPMAQASDSKAPRIQFTSEQRQVVIELLKAERSHACTWWTHLNEMRCRGELPAWVKLKSVGSSSDYDRWNADCVETNDTLFGIRAHLNSFDPALAVRDGVGTFVKLEVPL